MEKYSRASASRVEFGFSTRSFCDAGTCTAVNPLSNRTKTEREERE
jgi:hypothetical protein